MFKANLQVMKNDLSSMLLSSPILFFIMFLFAAWHFFANKKETLVAWGPIVPFSSGEGDSSRSNERGGGV